METEADLKIKYEAAEPPAAGEYPHAYGGPIPFACLTTAPVLLELGADGKHVIPELGALSSGAHEALEKDNESNSGTDDGMDRFDQHRFDEDD